MSRRRSKRNRPENAEARRKQRRQLDDVANRTAEALALQMAAEQARRAQEARVEQEIRERALREQEEQEAWRRTHSLHGLRSMDPIEFERLVAQLYAHKGWRTKVTKCSGDEGIDVLAEKDEVRVAIQCKRNNEENKVGPELIQMLSGAITQAGADTGIFITTSTFTAAAVKAARRLRIKLVDWERLLEELRRNHPDWGIE